MPDQDSYGEVDMSYQNSEHGDYQDLIHDEDYMTYLEEHFQNSLDEEGDIFDDDDEESYSNFEEDEEVGENQMDDEDANHLPAVTSSEVGSSLPLGPAHGETESCRVMTGGGKIVPLSNRAEISDGCAGGECSSQGQIDGLFCPICMQAWTCDGEHHICCLPCGHIYGMSCIKKWLEHHRGSAKCPQCKMKCTMNGVRRLYASRIAAADGESEKEIQFLRTKCDVLENERALACTEEFEEHWKTKLRGLDDKMEELRSKVDENREWVEQMRSAVNENNAHMAEMWRHMAEISRQSQWTAECLRGCCLALGMAIPPSPPPPSPPPPPPPAEPS